MQQSVTGRNLEQKSDTSHKYVKSQTQFKNAEQRFVIFLKSVISTLINPLKSSHSKLNISKLNIIFDAISNLYQFHMTSLNQLSSDTNAKPAIFRYYALFPSIYKKYFDSVITYISLPHLSEIFCISKTNIKKWFSSKCNVITQLYDATNTGSYTSLAQILRDIFIHCMQQSNKLENIATFKHFKRNIAVKSFKEQIRIHLKNTLLQKWENEYRQQFDLLHLEMVLTQTNIKLYDQQRRIMQQFEVQIPLKTPSAKNLFGLNKNKNKNNATCKGILYIFNDCVLITTKADKYKGLYDFNDDKMSFIQGADKKSITFSRDANDKKKLIIVLGKTECKMAFGAINAYKNRLKHNLSSASHSFSTSFNDVSETVNSEHREISYSSKGYKNISILPTPLPESNTAITPLSYKDNIPIYDEDDILNKDFLMDENTPKPQDFPHIDNDTDGSEEDHDFKMKILLKPKWATHEPQLQEYGQLPTAEYYAARREILDDVAYSQNMHIHNLFSKDPEQNKMLKHPFEMFLDDVNRLKQTENTALDICYKSDDELAPPLSQMLSLSTLGPSASVVANLGPDDNANANGTDFKWKVAPPTQSILAQFNLQTNNNLLLKEIKRLRDIVAENAQQIKSVNQQNAALKSENTRLKSNNDALNAVVKRYKNKTIVGNNHNSFSRGGPVKAAMNWSKSVDAISKNVKLGKQAKSHSFAVAQANRLRYRKRKSKKKINRCFTSPASQPIASNSILSLTEFMLPHSSQITDDKAQLFDNMRSGNDVSDVPISNMHKTGELAINYSSN